MIDWTLMTPHDVAVALRTLPHQVLYAWREDSAGGWARESVIEYRHHVRSMVERTPEGSWLGPRYEDGKRIPNPPVYATAEEAKAAYDVFFLKRGYCLHATDDGSAVVLVCRLLNDVFVVVFASGHSSLSPFELGSNRF